MQPTTKLLMVMMGILEEKYIKFYITPSYGHWNDKFFSQNNIDGLVQERRNSSALAMELHLSCTKALIYCDALGIKTIHWKLGSDELFH